MNLPIQEVINGNNLEVMKGFPENSIDMLATDCPYGISFMGRDWDKAIPSVEIWKESLRVLKHGAFAFIMCIPRFDCLSQMGVRLEEAGFRIDFSPIYWAYASGFPKGMNMGKKVDDLNGSYAGFQPKPAVEVIIVAMKPLSEKSFIDQGLSNGKGVTWLDDGRIPFQNENEDTHRIIKVARFKGDKYAGGSVYDPRNEEGIWESGGDKRGRFPSNLLVSDDVLNDLYSGANDSGSFSRYFSLDAWWDKKVKDIPKEVQKTFPFLLTPKASRNERNKGLEGMPEKPIKGKYTDASQFGLLEMIQNSPRPTNKNFHPTVKPIKLFSYMITLGSRVRDIVLDPFLGSGTMGIACELTNRRWIGIEINEEYCEIARARLKPYMAQEVIK